MNPVLRSLRDWFGYTRRERRSSFILLIIIIFIGGIRYLVPAKRMELEELSLKPLLIENEIVPEGPGLKEGISQEKKTLQKIPVRKVRIELNSCDSASLVALPGIGPVLSVRIIKYRNLIGGFIKVDQLREVYGLPEETFNLISSKVTVDPSSVRIIKINSIDYSLLARHPYLKKNEVNAILKFRELRGSIGGMDVMLENNLISEETAEKIRDYLEF
jgi:DNA uptake protein ComE-like DNA-binding protein